MNVYVGRDGHICIKKQQKCNCGYVWINYETFMREQNKIKNQFTGSGSMVGTEGRIKPDSIFPEECLSKFIRISLYSRRDDYLTCIRD